MNTIRKSLLDSGVLLAISTAALYCAGTAYYGGYLGELELDAEVLDQNFQQILYRGFLHIFLDGFRALTCFALIRFIYSHLFLNWLASGFKNRRKFLQFKYYIVSPRKDSKSLRSQKEITMSIMIYTVFFFLFICMLARYEHVGRDEAIYKKKIINREEVVSTSKFIHVKIDDHSRDLLYLTCGARNCAGVDLVNRTVYYFPENGHSFRYDSAPSLISSTKFK